jgi:hypothetical protein
MHITRTQAEEAQACCCYLAPCAVLQAVKPTGPKSDVPAANSQAHWLDAAMAVPAIAAVRCTNLGVFGLGQQPSRRSSKA